MIAVVVSDLHAGSGIGLWPEGMTDHEGAPLPQNAIQRWLDQQWWKMLGELLDLNERLIVVIDGDAIQGSHPDKDAQLTTASWDLQRVAAFRYLQPLREIADEMYMVHGTPWHEAAGGEHVRGLARDLGCHKTPAGDWLYWQLYLRLGEHVAHIAHHVGIARVPFYQASVPLRDMYMLAGELYREYGPQMPGVDLMVRAHRHQGLFVYKPPRFRVAITPCWQFPGEIVHKSAPEVLQSIGYLLIEETRHGLWAIPRVFPLPLPKIEIVEGWDARG